MNKKSMLLCTFTKSHLVDDKIREIADKIKLETDRVYVLNILNSENDCLLTYNALINDNYKELISNTINVHRKKQTNTLYTINAVNQIIKDINGGEIDESMTVPWWEYRNTLLLIRNEVLCKLKTKLSKVVWLMEKE